MKEVKEQCLTKCVSMVHRWTFPTDHFVICSGDYIWAAAPIMMYSVGWQHNKHSQPIGWLDQAR